MVFAMPQDAIAMRAAEEMMMFNNIIPSISSLYPLLILPTIAVSLKTN